MPQALVSLRSGLEAALAVEGQRKDSSVRQVGSVNSCRWPRAGGSVNSR